MEFEFQQYPEISPVPMSSMLPSLDERGLDLLKVSIVLTASKVFNFCIRYLTYCLPSVV